jgi:glycosyltransferase involved in cell wall biosynthesis
LRVALDDTLRGAPTTGIARYAQCLGSALERTGHTVMRWSAKSSTRFALTEVPRRIADEHPDVFHAVRNFNLPLVHPGGAKLVLTVHDLIPLLLPDTVSAAYRWQFRLWLSRSVRVADAIICVSETTRRALLERLEVEPRKLHVVHHGVDHVDHVPAPDEVSVKWLDALGLDRFVLYGGALDARKNLEQLIEACPFPLVLAGQRWFGHRAIERRIAAAPHVRALGYLKDPLFYALMRRASLFVYPSRYEGFGLPPLEAMRLGVPTLVSNAGALPEVCGGGACVTADLAFDLARLMRDEPARRELAQRGREHAARFTWTRCAEQTLQVYAG